MRLGIDAVGAAGGIIEAAVCYTGDISDDSRRVRLSFVFVESMNWKLKVCFGAIRFFLYIGSLRFCFGWIRFFFCKLEKSLRFVLARYLFFL